MYTIPDPQSSFSFAVLSSTAVSVSCTSKETERGAKSPPHTSIDSSRAYVGPHKSMPIHS